MIFFSDVSERLDLLQQLKEAHYQPALSPANYIFLYKNNKSQF